MDEYEPKQPNSLWNRILYYRLPVSDHAVGSIGIVVKFTFSIWLLTCLLACLTGLFMSPGRDASYERVDSSRWLVYHGCMMLAGALIGIGWVGWKRHNFRQDDVWLFWSSPSWQALPRALPWTWFGMRWQAA